MSDEPDELDPDDEGSDGEEAVEAFVYRDAATQIADHLVDHYSGIMPATLKDLASFYGQPTRTTFKGLCQASEMLHDDGKAVTGAPRSGGWLRNVTEDQADLLISQKDRIQAWASEAHRIAADELAVLDDDQSAVLSEVVDALDGAVEKIISLMG